MPYSIDNKTPKINNLAGIHPPYFAGNTDKLPLSAIIQKNNYKESSIFHSTDNKKTSFINHLPKAYSEADNNKLPLYANVQKNDDKEPIYTEIIETELYTSYGSPNASLLSKLIKFLENPRANLHLKQEMIDDIQRLHSSFINHTKEFYEFYRDKMNSLKFEPNITHIKLAKLEQTGKLKAIVTQNIDGLHQKAGSKIVYELHGSVLRNYCTKCHKFYDANYIFNSSDIPYCICGGIIKPDVVLYEEALNDIVLANAIKSISNADLLIIGGTSLTVYPAASLIYYFHGNNIVLINRDSTGLDSKANLVINTSLGNVFENL